MINELRKGNWKPINGWEDYEISEYGEIFSLRRGRFLKIWAGAKQYPRVTLSKNNKEKSFSVHRLVALTFIPNPDNKITVNHIDGNKHNNHYTNLEWNTFSENMIHAVNTGLCKPPNLGYGEKHPAAKLSNVDIEMIKVLINNDFTNRQIAKRFEVHEAHISAIRLNKTWRHFSSNHNPLNP